MRRFHKTIMKALGLRWRRQEETGCSGLNPVHETNCEMKATARETMPQESMVRAIQIRAPTRRGGEGANTGHSPTALRTGQIDPDRPFEIVLRHIAVEGRTRRTRQ